MLDSYLDRYFRNYSRDDYAKAGTIASETVVLQPGHMPMFSPYCAPCEHTSNPILIPSLAVDHLRKLGLVLEVEDGKVMLRTEFTAATEGEPLTAEQAKVLTHLKKPVGTFQLELRCHWSDGTFEEF